MVLLAVDGPKATPNLELHPVRRPRGSSAASSVDKVRRGADFCGVWGTKRGGAVRANHASPRRVRAVATGTADGRSRRNGLPTWSLQPG